MKSRRCSNRKRCSGFCSCPESNWPPRYSFHSDVVCITLPAASSLPPQKLHFSCPPHSCCLSVHYHCSATEWRCCVEQKSPLLSYLGDAESGCDVGFLSNVCKPTVSLWNRIPSLFCGGVNAALHMAAHTGDVLFIAHVCHECPVYMPWLARGIKILPQRIATWFWNVLKYIL